MYPALLKSGRNPLHTRKWETQRTEDRLEKQIEQTVENTFKNMEEMCMLCIM